MSGHKRALVALSNAEYQRLYEAQASLQQVSPEPARIQAQIQHASQAVLQDAQAGLEQRYQAFRQDLSQTDLRIQETAARLGGQLHECEHRLIQTLGESAGQLQQNIDQVYREMDERARAYTALEREAREAQIRTLEAQIHVLREDMAGYDTDIDDLTHRLDELDAQSETLSQLAIAWLDAAAAVARFVETQYVLSPPEAGTLDSGWYQVDLAEHNLAEGASQAALAIAQQAYLQFISLHLLLEQLTGERLAWQSVALEAVRHLHAQIRANQVVQALDLDGEPLDIPVNVNAWTGGRLTALENACLQLGSQLGSAETSNQALQEAVEVAIPQLYQRLEKIVHEARLAVLSSQIRVNLADLVVQALEGQGYRLTVSGYEGEDLRSQYTAQVEAFDGSQVEIRVAPTAQGTARMPGPNELHLLSSSPEPRSEHEMRRRAQEIYRALSGYGLRIGETETIRPTSAASARVLHDRSPRYIYANQNTSSGRPA